MDNLYSKIINYYDSIDDSYQHWGCSEIYNMHYGYWDNKTKNHLTSLERINEVVAEKSAISKNDCILDAGCGVGASSIWLAKNFPNSLVIGITLSNKQCKKAEHFASKEGISKQVRFFKQDFNKTDFKKGSFDIVWSIESYCHAHDKQKYLYEMSRILKPGGKIVIADYFLKKSFNQLNIIQKIFIKKWISGWAMGNFLTTNEFNTLAHNADFGPVNFTNITENILPSSKEIFKRGRDGYLIDKYIKKQSKLKINHVIACICQYLALRLGAWQYQIVVGVKQK